MSEGKDMLYSILLSTKNSNFASFCLDPQTKKNRQILPFVPISDSNFVYTNNWVVIKLYYRVTVSFFDDGLQCEQVDEIQDISVNVNPPCQRCANVARKVNPVHIHTHKHDAEHTCQMLNRFCAMMDKRTKAN